MASIIRSPRFDGQPRRLRNEAAETDTPATLDSSAQSKPPDRPEPADSETGMLEQRNQELQLELDRLRTEIETLRAKAEAEDYSTGYQLGLEAGSDEGRADWHAKQQTLAEVIESMREQAEQFLHQQEQTMVETVFAATAKILAGKVGDAAYLRELVGHEVARLSSQESIVVRLAPQDYHQLFDEETEQPSPLALDQVQFVPDDHVQCGGCIVDTERGGLDARLETQMQQFRELLLDVYRRRQGAD